MSGNNGPPTDDLNAALVSALAKLDGNKKIKDIFTQMHSLIIDLQKSCTNLSEENTDLKTDVKCLKKRLELSECLVTTLQKQNKKQSEEILDLQTRSMRDNLIFTGIPEKDNENLPETIRKFLKDEMNMQNSENVNFDRVHRTGPPGKQNRPIIAKLNPSSSKGSILHHGKNLKNKDFRVFEQFPQEVQERRKRLLPLFKKAKSDPSIKKVSWAVDKLIIDGRVHTANDAPLNIEPEYAGITLDLDHGQQINESGSTFQAHCADLNTAEDVQIVMANLLKNKSIANATHNMFAYRIGNDKSSRDGLNDDGEHGGARTIMNILKEHNIYNKIVIVTRWYGGSHIGPKRFEAIESCTKNILDI